jgi:hypothetical protein
MGYDSSPHISKGRLGVSVAITTSSAGFAGSDATDCSANMVHEAVGIDSATQMSVLTLQRRYSSHSSAPRREMDVPPETPIG